MLGQSHCDGNKNADDRHFYRLCARVWVFDSTYKNVLCFPFSVDYVNVKLNDSRQEQDHETRRELQPQPAPTKTNKKLWQMISRRRSGVNLSSLFAYEEWWPPKTCFETWNSCKGSLSVLCWRCNAHTCTAQIVSSMECGLHSNYCLRIGTKLQRTTTRNDNNEMVFCFDRFFCHFFYAQRLYDDGPTRIDFSLCPLVLPLSFALLWFLLINDDDGILSTAKRQNGTGELIIRWFSRHDRHSAFAKHTN